MTLDFLASFFFGMLIGGAIALAVSEKEYLKEKKKLMDRVLKVLKIYYADLRALTVYHNWDYKTAKELLEKLIERMEVIKEEET